MKRENIENIKYGREHKRKEKYIYFLNHPPVLCLIIILNSSSNGGDIGKFNNRSGTVSGYPIMGIE